MNATRVLVIGCGGTGKSTLAVELGRRTGLPVVHLDRLYWRPDWVPIDKARWVEVVGEVVRGERWILDGNYGGTIPQRLAACDGVVFLDLPRWLCVARVLRRRLAPARWRRRAGAPDGCPERMTWEFMAWIWTYRRRRRPDILRRLADLPPSTEVYILQSPSAVRRFLREIGSAGTLGRAPINETVAEHVAHDPHH